jgi:hypothetical protein
MLLFVAKLLFFNAEIVCLSASGGEQEYLSLKPQCMVLIPHGIQPTYLKFNLCSLGAGFYSYYNLQYIKLDKKVCKKKKVLCIQKLGSIQCWVPTASKV